MKHFSILYESSLREGLHLFPNAGSIKTPKHQFQTDLRQKNVPIKLSRSYKPQNCKQNQIKLDQSMQSTQY